MKEKKEKATKVKESTPSILKASFVKRLLKKYMSEDTQIEDEASNIFQKSLLDMIKMVSIEAERLARTRGTKRVSQNDIRDAVRIHLGVK